MNKIYTVNFLDTKQIQEVGSKKTAVKKGDESGQSYNVKSPSGQIVHEVVVEAPDQEQSTRTGASDVDPKIKDALDGKLVRDYPGNYAPTMAVFSTELADAFGGIRHEVESVKGRLNKVVTFRGEEALLAEFREALDSGVKLAHEDLHNWQKEHREQRRSLTDMQRFVQHRERLAETGKKLASAAKKARS